MERVRFFQHQGKDIVVIDFSQITDKQEVLRIIAEAQNRIAACPPASVYTVTDITGAYYDRDVSQALRHLAAHNKLFVKAAAVVGVTSFRKIVYNGVSFFSKRHFEICDDVDAALAWLAAQP